MQEVTFPITCLIDLGLAMSANELKVKYATDIPFQGLDGQRLTDNTIEQKIKAEQIKLQNEMDIMIAQTKMQEQQDFCDFEFAEWGFIASNYNVKEVISIGGYIGDKKVLDIDLSWISIKHQLDQFRNIYIIPNAGLWHTTLFALGFKYGVNSNYIPNFWRFEYIGGFDRIPLDIMEAIGKKTMLQVYNILGNILFGVGIASTSKSIDGLSQSIGTTQSATNALFGASINQLRDELKLELPYLIANYRSFSAMRL